MARSGRAWTTDAAGASATTNTTDMTDMTDMTDNDRSDPRAGRLHMCDATRWPGAASPHGMAPAWAGAPGRLTGEGAR